MSTMPKNLMTWPKKVSWVCTDLELIVLLIVYFSVLITCSIYINFVLQCFAKGLLPFIFKKKIDQRSKELFYRQDGL